MEAYNKLVGDKIPEVIEKQDKVCEVEIVEGAAIRSRLEDKMLEEFNEYLADKNLEELADMLEVVFGLAYHQGYSEAELLAKRDEKRAARGGFEKGIVLKAVKEKE